MVPIIDPFSSWAIYHAITTQRKAQNASSKFPPIRVQYLEGSGPMRVPHSGLKRDWINYISVSLTMSHGHQEPDHSEQEPRKEKRGSKTENGPVPGSSNH